MAPIFPSRSAGRFSRAAKSIRYLKKPLWPLCSAFSISGGDGNKAGRADVGVGVADVFGGEGQEYGFVAAVVEFAAEEVEKVEEGVLRAVGEGDVLFGNVPAVAAAEVGGQRGNQAGVALRGGVVGQAFHCRAVGGDLAQGVGEHLLYGGDVGGIAAAEHIDGFAFGEGAAEVVHQLQDAAVAGEFLAESGELHGVAFVGLSG